MHDFALLISVEEKLCGATVSSTDQTTEWSVGRTPSCEYKENPTTDVRLGLCVSPGKHRLPSRGGKDSSSYRRPTHTDLFPFTP